MGCSLFLRRENSSANYYSCGAAVAARLPFVGKRSSPPSVSVGVVVFGGVFFVHPNILSTVEHNQYKTDVLSNYGDGLLLAGFGL